MDPFEQTLGYGSAARRREVMSTIRDYRFLAGQKLALDDAREQAMVDVARSRLFADVGVEAGWRPTVAAARRRFGAALVAAGTRLQGAGGEVLADPVPATATARS